MGIYDITPEEMEEQLLSVMAEDDPQPEEMIELKRELWTAVVQVLNSYKKQFTNATKSVLLADAIISMIEASIDLENGRKGKNYETAAFMFVVAANYCRETGGNTVDADPPTTETVQ